MKRSIMTVLAASFLLMACDKPAEKKEEESKNASTTTGAQTAMPTATVAPAATAPTIADSDLSTPADFEEAAEKAITKTTYKTELASLETDIGKE